MSGAMSSEWHQSLGLDAYFMWAFAPCACSHFVFACLTVCPVKQMTENASTTWVLLARLLGYYGTSFASFLAFFFFFYLTQAVAYMKLALTQMLAHNAMHRVHWQADIFADAWITCTQRGGARQAFKHSRAESVCSEPLHSTPDDQLNCSCYNWPITFHRINDIANAMNHTRMHARIW